MALLSKEEITECFSRLRNQNPEPKPELVFTNAFTQLVAVVLSAQATDKSVNLATKELFKIADSPEKMIELGEENLIPYIKPIGLYKNKAKSIIGLSRTLIDKFNSKVPDTREELMSLPGVGRKTANVVLNVFFHKPTMPVDTHLLRISPRIGLVEKPENEKITPEFVEAELLKIIPEEFLQNAHHWLLLHGRYVCTAKNPKCETCILNDICKKNLEN